MTSLREFLHGQYVPGAIALSGAYARCLDRTVRQFGEWVGREPTTADLDEALLARWLHHYRRSHSDASTNNVRRMILTIWSAMAVAGLARPPYPRRVRTIREEPAIPEAWTVEEVGRILDAAGMLDGEVAELPACLWWPSLILVTYWTGCRIGALRRTPATAYRARRGLWVRAQKNKRPQWYDLPASCCAAIEAIHDPHRALLWPWPWGWYLLWRRFRRIVEAAGVPCPRTGRQLFHRLRRTNLSYCDAADPAIAQRQGGHASYRTTERYIDRSISRRRSAADVLPDPMLSRFPRIFG